MVVISKQNLDYSYNSGLNVQEENFSSFEMSAKQTYMDILNQKAREEHFDSPNETETEEQEANTKDQQKKQRKAERMQKWEMKKANLKNKKKKRNKFKSKDSEKEKETVENILETIQKEEEEKTEENQSQLNLDTDSPDELVDERDERVVEFLDSIANLFDKEMVEEIAKKTGFVKRKSKLTGHLFLTIFTFGINIYGSPTLTQLVGLLDLVADVQITEEGLRNRIKQEAVDFFSHMLSLGIQVVAPSELNIKFLDVFERIMITDSTAFQLSEKLAKYFAGSGGSASKAAVKIQFAYDLKSSQFLCLIQDGKTPDNRYDNSFVKYVREGDLHIRDLGYYNTQAFIDMDAYRAYFLSRLKSDVQVYTRNEQNELIEFDLDRYLEGLQTDSCELEICLKKDKEYIAVRLVVQKVPQEVKESRLRKIKKIASKKGHTTTQRTIIRQGFNLYITNLPQKMVKFTQEQYQSFAQMWPEMAKLLKKYTKVREEYVYIDIEKAKKTITSPIPRWIMLVLKSHLEVILAAEVFHDLYRIRWQIELIFKNWKSNFDLDKIRVKKNESFVKCMLYAKLMYIFIATKITFVAKSLLWSKEQKEVSELQAGSFFRIVAFRWLTLIIDCPSAVVPMLQRSIRFIMKRCIKSKRKGKALPLEILFAI